MNKRTFLKLTSAVVASRLFAPLRAWATGKLTNWAGNIEYSTDHVSPASTVEQVSDFVKKHDKFKVLGTRHCFNRIADSKDEFLSVKPMDEVVSLDPQARTVTLGAGMSYGQLAPYLHNKGFALSN